MLRVLLAGWVTVGVSAVAGGYFPKPDSEGGWRVVNNPGDVRRRAKLSPDRLDQAWEYTQRCSQNAGLLVVPSLDLVIYKMGGNNGQYDPTLTRVPQPTPSTARDDWKPLARTPFQEASNGGDDGIRRVLEMVCAACIDG